MSKPPPIFFVRVHPITKFTKYFLVDHLIRLDSVRLFHRILFFPCSNFVYIFYDSANLVYYQKVHHIFTCLVFSRSLLAQRRSTTEYWCTNFNGHHEFTIIPLTFQSWNNLIKSRFRCVCKLPFRNESCIGKFKNT